MTDILLRYDSDHIATLTLNRPAARNALSMGLMEALDAELAAIADDPGVRVVIIAGSGSAFCAGHDLREIRATPTRDAYAALFALCSRLMQRIVRLPKPVIAQVHGVATAAGCQLVASADMAVAAESARFATPGVDIGLFCSTPMVALSRNLAPKRAMEMLLLGEMIDAKTALDYGLVNRLVPEGGALEAAMELARSIAGESAATVAIGKRAFYEQTELGLDDAYALARRVMVENMLAHDAAEGIGAFLDKRPPHWEGR